MNKETTLAGIVEELRLLGLIAGLGMLIYPDGSGHLFDGYNITNVICQWNSLDELEQAYKEFKERSLTRDD